MKRRCLPPTFLLLAPVTVQGAASEPLVLQPSANTQAQGQLTELRDIHGPVPLSDPTPLLAIAAAVVLALATLFFLYRLWKRRAKKVSAPMPRAWEQALQALDAARHLLETGDHLAYLERVADILRRYIELRFSLPSTRQTTQEFLASLGDHGDSPLRDHRLLLQSFLELADLAKFARHPEERSRLEEVEDSLRRFIEHTSPDAAKRGNRP